MYDTTVEWFVLYYNSFRRLEVIATCIRSRPLSLYGEGNGATWLVCVTRTEQYRSDIQLFCSQSTKPRKGKHWLAWLDLVPVLLSTVLCLLHTYGFPTEITLLC